MFSHKRSCDRNHPRARPIDLQTAGLANRRELEGQGGIAETIWLQGYTNLAGPTSSDERTRPLRCIQGVLDIAWLHNVQ